MLSLNLYHFYRILSTPYDKFNSIFKKNFNLSSSILEDLYLKKFFTHLWIKKLNYPLTKVKSKYNYTVLEKNFNKIKISFNYFQSFVLNNYPKGVTSTSIDKYIIILEKINKNFKIIFIVNNEENPILYQNILKENLININNLISLKQINIWTSKIKVIDRLYTKFSEHINLYRSTYSREKILLYDSLKACEYAQKFALTPNNDYKLFEDIGGDCTNFISQAIYAGGIKTTNIWKPYSDSWVRVQGIYSFLISNKIGFEIDKNSPMTNGSIIQFYSSKLNRFCHSGMITHTLPNSDYLYCCHSYNKLNYPLSLTYPILYPKVRNIEIF